MYGIDFDFLPRSFLLVEKSCFSQPGPLPLLSSPLPCFAFLPPSCVSSFSVPFSARKENRELLCLAVLPLICRCLPLAFECAKVSSSACGSVFLSEAVLASLLLLDAVCESVSPHICLPCTWLLPSQTALSSFRIPCSAQLLAGQGAEGLCALRWPLPQLLPFLLHRKFLF